VRDKKKHTTTQNKQTNKIEQRDISICFHKKVLDDEEGRKDESRKEKARFVMEKE